MDYTHNMEAPIQEMTANDPKNAIGQLLWGTVYKLLGVLTYYLAAYFVCIIGLAFVAHQMISAFQYLNAVYYGSSKLVAIGYGLVTFDVTIVATYVVDIIIWLDER
jgi:uncharacterized membrane protein